MKRSGDTVRGSYTSITPFRGNRVSILILAPASSVTFLESLSDLLQDEENSNHRGSKWIQLGHELKKHGHLVV